MGPTITTPATPLTACPLHVHFERIVQTHPERTAVSFGRERLSYRDLNGRANDLAHRLEGLGVRTGQAVGVCLRPCPAIAVALLAIQKLGCAYVPLDPDYPQERLRDISADAALAVTLTDDALLGQLGDALAQPFVIPEAPAELPANLGRDLDEGGTAVIFYTSGTTGQPKGIALSRGNIAYYVLSAIRQFGINPEDRILSVARYSFSISLFDLLTGLLAGGELVILRRDVVMDFAALSAELARATVAHLGPSLLKGLVRHAGTGAAPSFQGLRHISSGGDFVPADLLEDLKTVFPRAELFVIYGCSEVACMGCFYPVPRDAAVERSFLGRAFPGTEVLVLGEDGTPAPAGAIGEICFHGPGVMTGYVNKPDLTRRSFVDVGGRTFYRTGDLGRIHDSGNLEFMGRNDFQIKLRGQRIELVEIEGHLRRAPGVRDAVLTAASVGSEEKRLIAYLTLEDPSTFHLGPVRDYLRARLPDYMVPSGWIVLDRMPLNVNLKISRRDLPPPTLDNLIDTEPHVAPRSDEERLLAGIWQEVLGIPQVGVTDDFFGLGGDSLMVMNVCLLAAEHGLRITPSRLAKAPTIAALAAGGIPRYPQGGAAAAPETESETLTSIPPVVLRFLYERGSNTPHHWNISRIVVARRPLVPVRVEQAFRQLGARHDALRLRFESVAGRWQARILESSEETLAFRTVDLSHLSREAQDRTIAEVAGACQQRVNLTIGPLACMVLFELGEGRRQELFFVVHHFAMDVISWKIFWLELDSAYRRLEEGRTEPMPPPALSFRDWTEALRGCANAPEAEAAVQDWVQRDWAQVPTLPKDLPSERERNTNDSALELKMSLSPEETRALQRHAERGASVECVLLGALAFALARWQGTGLVHFDRLVHGRNLSPREADVSRTVGCMISYAPALLAIDPGEPAEAILRGVAAQMERAGDSGTLIDLYRYLGTQPALAGALARLPRTEVLINYRGKIDDVIDRSHLFSHGYGLAGLDHDPAGLRLYPLAISVDVVDDHLETRFVYSTNLHRRDTIERLGTDFTGFIRAALGR